MAECTAELCSDTADIPPTPNGSSRTTVSSALSMSLGEYPWVGSTLNRKVPVNRVGSRGTMASRPRSMCRLTSIVFTPPM